MSKKSVLNELMCLGISLIASFMTAFTMHYFVNSANFAPAGIEGIAAMLQKLTGWNTAYFLLIFNIPLLAVAWFMLKKRYVIYTLIFMLGSSGILVIFEQFNFPTYTSGVADGLIAAIFSGIILGVRTGIMLRMGASAGGMDIVGSMIQSKKPHLNIERVITILCYLTILASFFVYGEITSILLAFVQMFVFDKFAGYMLKDRRNAVEVKIVTDDPEPIRNEIINTLRHGATAISAKGMYTSDDKWIIISVINIKDISAFFDIIKRHPGTFAYYGEMMGVMGNFRWKKSDEAK